MPPIEPIYIIGNNDVVVDNQSELNIFRPSYFVHFLRKQEKKVNNMEDLKHFMTWVENYRSPAKKYPLRAYLQQFKHLAEVMLLTAEINSYYYEIGGNILEDIKKEPKLYAYLQKENKLNN